MKKTAGIPDAVNFALDFKEARTGAFEKIDELIAFHQAKKKKGETDTFLFPDGSTAHWDGQGAWQITFGKE